MPDQPITCKCCAVNEDEADRHDATAGDGLCDECRDSCSPGDWE